MEIKHKIVLMMCSSLLILIGIGLILFEGRAFNFENYTAIDWIFQLTVVGITICIGILTYDELNKN